MKQKYPLQNCPLEMLQTTNTDYLLRRRCNAVILKDSVCGQPIELHRKETLSATGVQRLETVARM